MYHPSFENQQFGSTVLFIVLSYMGAFRPRLEFIDPVGFGAEIEMIMWQYKAHRSRNSYNEEFNRTTYLFDSALIPKHATSGRIVYLRVSLRYLTDISDKTFTRLTHVRGGYHNERFITGAVIDYENDFVHE